MLFKQFNNFVKFLEFCRDDMKLHTDLSTDFVDKLQISYRTTT